MKEKSKDKLQYVDNINKIKEKSKFNFVDYMEFRGKIIIIIWIILAIVWLLFKFVF